MLRHAPLGRALGALLRAGGVLGAAQASESGALCAEAAYLQVQFGTVGDPFAYSEGLGCLPGGDSFSNAVIDWGDGSTSAGTLGAVTHRPGRYAVLVSLVEARGHVLVSTVGQATVTPRG